MQRRSVQHLWLLMTDPESSMGRDLTICAFEAPSLEANDDGQGKLIGFCQCGSHDASLPAGGATVARYSKISFGSTDDSELCRSAVATTSHGPTASSLLAAAPLYVLARDPASTFGVPLSWLATCGVLVFVMFLVRRRCSCGGSSCSGARHQSTVLGRKIPDQPNIEDGRYEPVE